MIVRAAAMSAIALTLGPGAAAGTTLAHLPIQLNLIPLYVNTAS
jgi:hypothetical protein